MPQEDDLHASSYSRAQFSRLVQPPISARYRAATAGPSVAQPAPATGRRAGPAPWPSPGRAVRTPEARLAHVRDDRARERRHVPPVRVARGHEPVRCPGGRRRYTARLSQVSRSLPGGFGGTDDLHLAEVGTTRAAPSSGARPSPGTPPGSAGSPPRPRPSRRRSTSGPSRKSSTAWISVAASPYCIATRYCASSVPSRRPIRRTENAGVQRRGDQAVAHVEVPVPLVPVLPPEVGVPDAGAGQRHRGEAVGAGAVAVLDVVPLEEQRQRVADRRGRSSAGIRHDHQPLYSVSTRRSCADRQSRSSWPSR